MRKPVRLVPELISSDIERSLAFHIGALGFRVLYARPEERFTYLEREGAEIMLEQSTGRAFVAGALAHPARRPAARSCRGLGENAC